MLVMMMTAKREECRLLFIRIDMKLGSLFETVAEAIAKKKQEQNSKTLADH